MITAAWSPTSPRAILVELNGPDGPALVTRTDRNGTAALPGVPDLIGGVALVTDHEPALAGPVSYTYGGDTVTVPAYTGAEAAYLQPVGLPAAEVEVLLITDDTMSRDTSTAVHEVIGRADPVAILRPLLTRTGTLTLDAADASTARNLAALGDAVVLLLRHASTTADLDTYLVVTAARFTPRESGRYGPAAPGRWVVELDYRAVRRPAGAGTGGVWTWQAVGETFVSWQAVGALFTSWRDLLAGPR